MFLLSNALRRGKRASDHSPPAPPPPRRDPQLEALIAEERVGLLFQPQIVPASSRIAGAEALARWDGASPEKLFARAAAAGLAERLSRLLQRKALRSAAAWEGPLTGLGISINLLPEDVARHNYECWLLDEIERVGIDPRRVTVEITEGGLLADRVGASERLARLREAGVKIAVDDFGTGYASLAYLTSLPLDTLKIDRGLIADIVGGSRDRIVVKAMIRLARELHLKVIVEGVESHAQLRLLEEWGCDFYQGFLGAPALDEAELERFITASARNAA